MTDITAKLSLPYILPSQAQKHVTHNEALQRLDAAIQLVVTATSDTPPDAAEDGTCYLIDMDAKGEWASRNGQLSIRQDDAWVYLIPAPGWVAWFADSGAMKVLQGNDWIPIPLPDTVSLFQLGISTEADDQNRLAVSSPASLLTHAAGGGHQLKINKATASDTGSLLFQTDWSGRAEMGLAGDDAFSIKMSSDGSRWQTGMTIDGDGVVTMPNRPLARAGRQAGVAEPADGSISGFSELPVSEGGLGLGDVVSGDMRALHIPVSGSYLITLNLAVLTSSGHSVALRINWVRTDFAVSVGVTSETVTQSSSFIITLSKDDRLSLSHSGACRLAMGSGKTELCLSRL